MSDNLPVPPDDEQPPDTTGWRTVAKLSPEQTASWLGGESVPWTGGIVDPEMRARFDRQKAAVRAAFWDSIESLATALDVDSKPTAYRLRELAAGAMGEGGYLADAEAFRLLMVMWNEVLEFSFARET